MMILIYMHNDNAPSSTGVAADSSSDVKCTLTVQHPTLTDFDSCSVVSRDAADVTAFTLRTKSTFRERAKTSTPSRGTVATPSSRV